MSLCHGRHHLGKSFRLILAPFFVSEGLPFANVLTEQQIEQAVEAEGIEFGAGAEDVYTPAITLWAFLTQVLHQEGLRSCRAAVKRVIVLLTLMGRPECSTDTGAYCRARAKLTEGLVERLAVGVANELEAAAPGDWMWCGRHVKLVDGTTFHMPDTEANQQAYPQSPSQQPGLGFPIARMTAIFSLATAAMCGMAIGPCEGKQTSELAMLRGLLDHLNDGDLLLGDRFYCSYFMLALAQQRNVDWVVRLHQRRKSDFRQGRRLGKGDHVVEWTKPARPDWMDEQTYAAMPNTLAVREVQVQVREKGFRVEQLTVVTTLMDPGRYPKEKIAELFRYRWHVELDIRAIKETIGLHDLRCKTPQMVRKEVWAHWLLYNLIRKTIAQAAVMSEDSPRQLSFAGAHQAVASSWDHLTISTPQLLLELGKIQLEGIATHQVGNRPDRVEPRAVKRRPKKQKFLTKPRSEARAELLAGRGAS